MNKPKILDHDYDGIQEEDNPLPRWWLLLFYACIVFAVIYTAHYSFGPGKNPNETLPQELEALAAQRKINTPPSEVPNEEIFALLTKDSAKMGVAHELFEAKCASCHGVKGEGGIGPNLTDNFWVHGDGSFATNHKVISEGVLDKGMPPWGAMLKPEELNLVVAYVKTLAGTNPANPKAPQGIEHN